MRFFLYLAEWLVGYFRQRNDILEKELDEAVQLNKQYEAQLRFWTEHNAKVQKNIDILEKEATDLEFDLYELLRVNLPKTDGELAPMKEKL